MERKLGVFTHQLLFLVELMLCSESIIPLLISVILKGERVSDKLPRHQDIYPDNWKSTEVGCHGRIWIFWVQHLYTCFIMGKIDTLTLQLSQKYLGAERWGREKERRERKRGKREEGIQITFFSPKVNVIFLFFKDDENKIFKKSLSFDIPIFIISGSTNRDPVKYCRAQQNCKKETKKWDSY